MPRSPTRHHHATRHNPLSQKSPTNDTSRQASVIELSSDDSEAPIRTSPSKQRRKKAPPVPASEILEISSDEDESGPPPPKSTIPVEIRKHLAELAKVKKENDILKRQAKQYSKEITELKATAGPSTLNVNDFEDTVCCEICTAKMWSPYILECGHMFCATCTTDWFETCLRNHQNRHPQQQNNHIVNQLAPLLNTYRYNLPMIHQLLLQYQNMLPPTPDYTCPTCREKVRRKPIEAFRMKDVVRMVAAAHGESSPRKAATVAPTGDRRSRHHRAPPPPPRADPFAKFFP